MGRCALSLGLVVSRPPSTNLVALPADRLELQEPDASSRQTEDDASASQLSVGPTQKEQQVRIADIEHICGGIPLDHDLGFGVRRNCRNVRTSAGDTGAARYLPSTKRLDAL